MFKDNDNTDTRELDIARIVPVQDREGEPVVSGRALHYFLEVGTRYNDWFSRMLGYGFTEATDYVLISEYVDRDHRGEVERADHLLSLDMAKELAMIQRTARGKQARQYFIAVEKRARSLAPALPQSLPEALRAFADAEEKRLALASKVEADAPKVLFADSVAASTSTVLVGELAKILRGNGVEIGQNRLFERLRDEGYLIRRRGSDWNMPTQYAMELGLFEIKETAVTHSDGHVTVSKTPKVTGKGQAYFVNRYLEKAVA